MRTPLLGDRCYVLISGELVPVEIIGEKPKGSAKVYMLRRTDTDRWLTKYYPAKSLIQSGIVA